MCASNASLSLFHWVDCRHNALWWRVDGAFMEGAHGSQGPWPATANLHPDCVFLCCNMSFYFFCWYFVCVKVIFNLHFSIKNGQTSRIFTGAKLGLCKLKKSQVTWGKKLLFVLRDSKDLKTTNKPTLFFFNVRIVLSKHFKENRPPKKPKKTLNTREAPGAGFLVVKVNY